MMLWNYLKNEMLKHQQQTVGEDGCTMTFEEIAIYSEIFSEKINNELSCGIVCISEMAAAIALLSCFAAGVTAVPVSMRYGERHMRKIIDNVNPTCIITDKYGDLQVIYLKNNRYILPRKHPAVIMHTSGTEGNPKGVMLSEQNIYTNLLGIKEYFSIGTDDCILITRPLIHCAVMTGEFLISLIKGVRIQFCSSHFNPTETIRRISAYKANVFCGTPTILGILSRLSKMSDLTFLNTIVISGECLSRNSAEKIIQAFPHACIYHVYGLTEAGPRVCFLPPQAFNDASDCVGIPLKNVRIKVVGPDGNDAETGEIGDLYVRGENIMLGYYNNEKLTRSVLKDGWLCTGDTAVVNKNGFLKILGRKDDMIIRSGMNIYPQEIESEIKSDSRVREVLVRGVYREGRGTELEMLISGSFECIDDIKKLCIKKLPLYQVPSRITLVDDIPKNSSGKLIRG